MNFVNRGLTVKRAVILAVLIPVIMVIGAYDARAGWQFDIESGAAINGYNDVRIPGKGGTYFSLTEDLDSDPYFFYRVRFSRDLGERHYLSLLVAPLRFKSHGSPDWDVLFVDKVFNAGDDLTGHYRFDSYRLTYRYTLHKSERLTAGIGLTAKIRDAEISLEDADQKATKKNTGFVPLVNFQLQWRLNSKLGILAEGDALAAPQGRAEDILLALTGDIDENLRLKVGYRLLEGGADNDEVYTFALVHYLVVGIVWNLKPPMK